jgi:hypothetical protein
MDPWLRKYKTQTGYMSPYYLSKAYITNNIVIAPVNLANILRSTFDLSGIYYIK